MTDTDTTGLKRIGDAHLYMRGLQSQVGMESVPGDLLVFDELNETEPMAKHYPSRSRQRMAETSTSVVLPS